ncbi:MAG: hypothetical protein LBJ87_02010 [bacterium]|nr:hypothetical protein [bacterium]
MAAPHDPHERGREEAPPRDPQHPPEHTGRPEPGRSAGPGPERDRGSEPERDGRPDAERRGLGVPAGPRLTNPPPPARRALEPPPPAAPPPPPRRRRSLRPFAIASGAVVAALLVIAAAIWWIPNLALPVPSPPGSSPPAPSPTPFAWLPQLTITQVTGPLEAAGYSCGQRPQAATPGLRATGCTRQTGSIACDVLIRAQDERHVWEVAATTRDPSGKSSPDPGSALGCDQTAVQLALQHDPARVEQVMGFVRQHIQDGRATSQIGSLNVLLQHDQNSFTCDLTAGYR